MDKKDWKIINELSFNSRISVNQLAKKVGVSREVAQYRIKNLKRGVIMGLYPVISSSSLNFNRYGCWIKLKGISSMNEKNFIDSLVKHDFITYLSPVVGKWNVVFDILAKDREHLRDIFNEITKDVQEHLHDYVIIETTKEEDIFTERFGVFKGGSTLSKFRLDKIDKQILGILSQNSRIEYKEIGSKLNLSGNAIKRRIKTMEKTRVILGYTILVNYKELGYQYYNIQLKSGSADWDSKLKYYLKNHKKVIYHYSYLGNQNWDMDVGILAKDPLELRDFVLSLRENFGNIIDINDIYLFVDVLKGATPKGIFKIE